MHNGVIRRLVALATALVACCALWAGTPITYTLPTAGNVSLAVYDAQGRQVRTLLSGARQEAGAHTMSWDGLDWMGRAVPAGAYSWRLLQSPGLKAEFLMRIGTSFNLQEWPANHGGPNFVASDGTLAVVSAGGECTPHIGVVELASGKLLQSTAGGISPGDIAAVAGKVYLFGGRDGQDNARLSLIDMAPWKNLGGRVLETPVRRITFCAADAPIDAQGWEKCGLTLYAPERGYGWDKLDGLQAGTSTLKQAKSEYLGTIEGKERASAATLRTFTLDVPKGQYLVRVQVGDESHKGAVTITCGLKDGKPNQVARLTVNNDWQTATFKAESTDGKLQLGFNTDNNTAWSWSVRAVEVIVQAGKVSANTTTVAVAYGNGRIEWLSPDATLESLGAALVEDVKDLAVTPAGSVLAITGNRVVEVSRNATTPVERIADLKNPRCISVEEASGDILIVADGGSGQILRYRRDFTFARAYGRPGGRQQGHYVPEDFCSVNDIAADGQGGFLISEDWSAPRRVAHFNGDGTMQREWYGGQIFFTLGATDPADPQRVWLNSHWGWIMEAQVDYEKRSWTPRTTYAFNGIAEGLYNNSLITTWQVLRHGDQRYLVRDGSTPRMLRIDEEGRRLVPLIASDLNATHYGSPSPTLNAYLTEQNKTRGRNPYQSYLWQDANGDGMPQRDEFLLSAWTSWGARWSIDKDFTYTCWELSPNDPKQYRLRRLPVKAWDGNRPVYGSFDEAEVVTVPVAPELLKAKSAWEGSPLAYSADGFVYQGVKGAGEGFTADYQRTGHSGLWPTSLINSAALCKWSVADGTLQWRVGKLSTTAKEYQAGEVNDPTRLLGRVQGCVLLASRIVMPLSAWTEDGLYAGSMFDHRADDGLPDGYYTWWRGPGADGKSMEAPLQYDMMVGGSIHELPNGDLLFFGAGWNQVPVYRVTGFKEFTRQQGALRVEEAAPTAAATGTGLSAEYFAGDGLQGAPVQTRLDPLVWFGNADTRVKKAWPDLEVCKQPTFSARWSGWIEPRYTEAYTIKAYVGPGKDNTPPDRVRVWMDGKLIIDGWERAPKAGEQLAAAPITLQAGQKVAIKVEYAKTVNGYLHLCWESATQEIEHIPTAFLYPLPPATQP